MPRILMTAFAVCVLVSHTTMAQNMVVSVHKEESSIVKKGNKAYQEMRYSLAAKYYQQYARHESPKRLSIDVLRRLADCLWLSRQLADCLNTYEKMLVVKKDMQFTNKEKIRIAELYARAEQYESASKWLSGVLGYDKKAQAYVDKQMRYSMMKDSDCWQIWPLQTMPGYRVFAPLLMDSILVFTGVKIGDSKNVTNQRNIAYRINVGQELADVQSTAASDYKRTVFYKNNIKKRRLANVYEGSDVAVNGRDKYAYFNEPVAITKDTVHADPVNGMDGERSQFMSIAVDDHKNVYFTSTNENNDGANLMQGEYNRQGVQNIRTVRLRGWGINANVVHPTVNPQGNLLVFSSNKGIRDMDYDLYYSHKDSLSGEWKDPAKLTVVNTVGNEIFPSIAADGYLYFSSDNMPGMGGLDIYRIRLNEVLNNKGSIEHLGYPVNSSADDYGWTQYPDSVSGYFTSDRNLAVDNIYGFRYTPKININGVVRNTLTGDPVSGATVFACDPLTGKVAVVSTDTLGRYTLRVKKGSELVVRTAVNPYDTVFVNHPVVELSKNVVVRGDEMQPDIKDLSLTKLSKGVRWAMDTVFYDFNKWEIKPESYRTLNKVVNLLKAYPLVHIEIAAYADPRGSDEYNLWLSQQRANSVVQYLIGAGVRADRVVGRGYGKAEASGDALNNEKVYRTLRRTEIRISGYDKKTDQKDLHPVFDWNKIKGKEVLEESSFPAGFFSVTNQKTEPVPEPSKPLNDAVPAIVMQPKPKVVAKPISEPRKKERKMIYHPIVESIEGQYCLQVGVFSNRSNAARLISKLEPVLPKTLQCFVLELNSNLFKVRAGYFTKYEEALKMAAIIEKSVE